MEKYEYKKSEDELNKMSFARLKKYHRAEQRKYNSSKPMGDVFKNKKEEEFFTDWHKYLMFVKTVKLTRWSKMEDTDYKIE